MRHTWFILVVVLLSIFVPTLAGGQSIDVCSDSSVAIPDGTTITSSLTVSDDLNISDVKVGVDITHAFIGQLDLTLKSAEETEITLMRGDGGSADNVLVTFSDGGATFGSVSFACDCEMQPEGPAKFADLIAESSAGVWTLEVTDNFGVDVGTLAEWCLLAEGCAVQAPNELAVTAGDGADEFNATWSNPESYSALDVYVDDVLYETVDGGDTTATLEGIACGRHTIRLEATADSVDCVSRSRILRFAACMQDYCAHDLPISVHGPVEEFTLDVTEDITVAALEVPFVFPVRLTWSWVFDLTSPADTTVRLHDFSGSGTDTFDLVWADAGKANARPYDCDGCAIQPVGPGTLADFDGESALGVWTLSASGTGSGTILTWCLGFPVAAADCAVTPPSDVSCKTSGCEVEISWKNTTTYPSIEVLRDGQLVAVVAGDTNRHVDTPGCAGGTYSYMVRALGDAADCSAESPSCEATIEFQNPIGFDLFQVQGASLLLDLPEDALAAGSEPRVATLELAGARLGTAGPFELGTADMVLLRKEPAILPSESSDDSIAGEVTALAMTALDPFSLDIAGRPSVWNVHVQIADEENTAEALVTMFRTSLTGGTYDLDFAVDPVLVFERRPHFRRGDANFDFRFDISDPIFTLMDLFLDGPTLCSDAADADDSGSIGIGDALLTLNCLFNDGREPAAPFPLAGDDPTTDDALGCEASTGSATFEPGATVLSGSGAGWGPLADCATAGLAAPRFGLGFCMGEMTLTGEPLELHIAPAEVDLDRPPADVSPDATLDPEVASLGRGAVISPGVTIGPGVVVGPRAFIGEDVTIGALTLIGEDVAIGAGTTIGEGTILDARSLVSEHVTVGAGVRVGQDCAIGEGAVIGDGSILGDGCTLGLDAFLGESVILKALVTFGEGASAADGIKVEVGYVVEDFTVLLESLYLCTEELGDDGYVGTIADCEEADGAVIGDIPDLGDDDLTHENIEDVLGALSSLFPPGDPLEEAVRDAGSSDPRGPIKDRMYVPEEYDCDDFAGDMEEALDALGYDATVTIYWDWADNSNWRWYNFLWTKSKILALSHAVTDVHLDDGTILWIEPQEGRVKIDLDMDGDGKVGFDTSHGELSDLTEGERRIEVYDSRAEAEAAGVRMDNR